MSKSSVRILPWCTPVALAFMLACPLAGRAQTLPVQGAFQFSNGVHPTFDASFEQATEREVTAFWKNELKGVSMKVGGRKEMIGQAARIPNASSDTLRILVAVEKGKGTSNVTAHIAFFTTAGYVGPDSPPREQDGCREWVRQRMVALKRELARTDWERGQRQLALAERQLDMLKREGQRAENNLRKTEQRRDQAASDQEAARKRLQELNAAPDTAGLDSTAQVAAGKARQKELRLWQDRARRAEYTLQDAVKKLDDLRWELKKNGEDQQAKQAEVEQQRILVNGLQEKFRAIN